MKKTLGMRLRSLFDQPGPKRVAFDEEAQWAEAIAHAKQTDRQAPPASTMPPPKPTSEEAEWAARISRAKDEGSVAASVSSTARPSPLPPPTRRSLPETAGDGKARIRVPTREWR